MCGSDPPMNTPRRTTGVAPSWNPPLESVTPQELYMSARRLSRRVGRAVAFAAVVAGLIFGGIGVANATETGDSIKQVTTYIIDWE